MIAWRSVKTQVTAVVVAGALVSVGLFPYVGLKIEERLVSAFESQSAAEQRKVLLQNKRSHLEGLSSWMRPWFNAENLAPLLDDEEARDLEAWRRSLLGVGNQIGAVFGVKRIISFDAEAELLDNYAVDLKSKAFDPALIEKVALSAATNEAVERHTVVAEDGEPYMALAMLGEDEDGEVATVHVLLSSFQPILNEFKETTGNDAMLRVGNLTLQTDFAHDYLSQEVVNGCIVVDDLRFRVRSVPLLDDFLGVAGNLSVYVDMTKVSARIDETRTLVLVFSAIATFLLTVFCVVILSYLLRPLRSIMGMTQTIATGQYEKRVEEEGAEEFKSLAQSFNVMVRSVQRQDANLKSLLASLTEGIFLFDRDGTLAPERSQALSRILPESGAMRTAHEFFDAYAGKDKGFVDDTLEGLWDESDFLSPFDGMAGGLGRQLVVHTEDGKRNIQLEYRQSLAPEGHLDKVVVSVNDITERLEAERFSKIQAERVDRIAVVAADTDAFHQFHEEVAELVQGCSEIIHAGDLERTPELKQHLHTAKANTALFNFLSLSHAIHQLESALIEASAAGTLAAKSGDFSFAILSQWFAIEERWVAEIADIYAVLGLSSGNDYLRVSREKLEALLSELARKKERALRRQVLSLRRHPVSVVFQQYVRLVDSLGRKTAKSVALRFAEASDEVCVDEIRPLHTALLHILRNCVDHGIEPPLVRNEAGKKPEGTIWIACQRAEQEGTLTVEIRDDGAGIHTDKLVAKAVAGGLWTEDEAAKVSDAEKLELIFAPELSTADTVTATSGRGVGMDAVRTSLQSQGASIEVGSTMGEGTVFTIVLRRSNVVALKAA